MNFFETFQEKVIEKRFRAFFRNFRIEETAVVNIIIVAFERFFIPQHREPQQLFTERAVRGNRNFVDFPGQTDRRRKQTIRPFRFYSVDFDSRLRIGDSFHLDFQILIRFDSACMIENRPVPDIRNFQHVSASFPEIHRQNGCPVAEQPFKVR